MADTIQVKLPAVLTLTIEAGEVVALAIAPNLNYVSVVNSEGFEIHVGEKTAARVSAAVDNSDWPVLRQPLPPGITWDAG